MAMLTPDMGHHWPVRFFVDHGVLVIAGIVLARLSPLRRGAMWRAYGLLLVYGGLIGTFDWAANANFAYLRGKPPISALSFMGPWPLYIVGTGVFALFLFWLLSIPLRRSNVSESARAVLPPPAPGRTPSLPSTDDFVPPSFAPAKSAFESHASLLDQKR